MYMYVFIYIYIYIARMLSQILPRFLPRYSNCVLHCVTAFTISSAHRHEIVAAVLRNKLSRKGCG